MALLERAKQRLLAIHKDLHGLMQCITLAAVSIGGALRDLRETERQMEEFSHGSSATIAGIHPVMAMHHGRKANYGYCCCHVHNAHLGIYSGPKRHRRDRKYDSAAPLSGEVPDDGEEEFE
jgi:hypothetical protein